MVDYFPWTLKLKYQTLRIEDLKNEIDTVYIDQYRRMLLLRSFDFPGKKYISLWFIYNYNLNVFEYINHIPSESEFVLLNIDLLKSKFKKT